MNTTTKWLEKTLIQYDEADNTVSGWHNGLGRIWFLTQNLTLDVEEDGKSGPWLRLLAVRAAQLFGSIPPKAPATIVAAVRAELLRARNQHAEIHHMYEGLGVIVEEVLELAEAVRADKGDTIRREAIQVAATAVRMIEDLGL